MKIAAAVCILGLCLVQFSQTRSLIKAGDVIDGLQRSTDILSNLDLPLQNLMDYLPIVDDLLGESTDIFEKLGSLSGRLSNFEVDAQGKVKVDDLLSLDINAKAINGKLPDLVDKLLNMRTRFSSFQDILEVIKENTDVDITEILDELDDIVKSVTEKLDLEEIKEVLMTKLPEFGSALENFIDITPEINDILGGLKSTIPTIMGKLKDVIDDLTPLKDVLGNLKIKLPDLQGLKVKTPEILDKLDDVTKDLLGNSADILDKLGSLSDILSNFDINIQGKVTFNDLLSLDTIVRIINSKLLDLAHNLLNMRTRFSSFQNILETIKENIDAEGITEILDELDDIIKDVTEKLNLEKIEEVLMTKLPEFGSTFENIIDIIPEIKVKVGGVKSTIPNMMGQLGDVVDDLTQLKDVLGNLKIKLPDLLGLKDKVPEIKDKLDDLTSKVPDVLDDLTNNLPELDVEVGDLVEKLPNLEENLVNLKETLPEPVSKLPAIISGILDKAPKILAKENEGSEVQLPVLDGLLGEGPQEPVLRGIL